MNIKTLHIFNPEHDIALAANLSNFTAPHAGRQLRNDLGFLPALWAHDGDAVLVDSVAGAERAYKRLKGRLGKGECLFVDPSFLQHLSVERMEPWGWDKALWAQLLRNGFSEPTLPSNDEVEQIRQLSHRRTSAVLLPFLQQNGIVGEAWECSSMEQVEALISKLGQVVLKAPWSSSGRGVRFDANMAWVQHVLVQQGSVMVEPFYEKVKDFGMEFSATDEGIRYEGLSLFQTKNGAYTGNVLATEKTKRQMLGRYVSLELLDAVCDQIVNHAPLGDYRGPFGVDMMLVHNSFDDKQLQTGGKYHAPLMLHPCVEINLRRTMGHVALVLTQLVNPTQDDDIIRVMRVIYNGNNYQLKIQR